MSQIPSESFTVRSALIDDAEAITNLINAYSIEKGIEERETEQNIRAMMETPGLNLETDTLLAIDEGDRIVGCAMVQDNPPNTLLLAMAEVHPQHRGQGVGTGLCRWIEDRSRQAIPRLPAEARVAVLQKRASNDRVSQALLLKHGYQVVRHNFRMVIEMDRPPSQPLKPEGIVIRPFIRDEEGRVLVQAILEAFRDNWGFVERPFELEYERWMHILDSDEDPEAARFWFVAVDGSEIAGFVLSKVHMSQGPEDAWIYVVGVLRAWRRRGIALALLHHSFRELYQHGKRRVRLEVDTQNPTGATRLYEKAGMHVENSYDFFEKELHSGKK